MITVAKDNSGDFDSIQKAVDSVSDNNNETIFIKKGIYKERIEIRKNNITLIGEDKFTIRFLWESVKFPVLTASAVSIRRL